MTKKDGKTFRDLDSILLSFANGQYESDLNLFGCACCRRIWSVLNDERLRRGVEVRELYERGLASGEKLADAKLNARIARREIRDTYARLDIDEHSPESGPVWAAGAASNAATGNYRAASKLAARSKACM